MRRWRASSRRSIRSCAHRGDLGIVVGEESMTAVVFVGANVVGKDVNGMLHVPRSQVTRAFRVP